VIDSSIAFETRCLQLSEDSAEKSVIKATIQLLKNDRREQSLLLIKASDTTMRLIGPAPGTTISTPPPYQTPITTPSNQLPPARQPSTVTRAPAIIPPSTPSRSTRLPAPQPDVPYTPINSSPPPSTPTTCSSTSSIFNFSSISTPTPLPYLRPSTSTKRSKPTRTLHCPT
jgi:hypothetical protein